MKIYLDTCCYNRPLDDQSQIEIQLETAAKLNIQEKVREDMYELIWSYMLNLENEANLHEDKRKAVQVWEDIAKFYCKPSQKVLDKGIELKKLGIKPKDTLHIACAISTECDYFITCDKGILKKDVKEIKVTNPIDFVRNVNNYED